MPFPWFIVAFVAVMLLNSAFTLHPQARRIILDVDQFLFLMVMVALGLTTRLARLREAGGAWRLIGVGVVGLLLSTVVAYGLVAPLSAGRQAPHPSSAESAMLGERRRPPVLLGRLRQVPRAGPAGRDGEVTLYSDLLLHDMGPALDDKIVQGDATGAEWRTDAAGRHSRLRHATCTTAAPPPCATRSWPTAAKAEIVRDRFFDLDEADSK